MDKPPWEGMGGYTDIDSTTLPMIDAQTPTFMGVPLAQDAAALNGADVAIIGAPMWPVPLASMPGSINPNGC